MKLDIVICGSAGQGILTLANVIVRAAGREGFDAHFSAHSGIAQLEGPVAAHVRVGTPCGASLKIPHGKADIIVALDRLEALRARPFVAPGKPVLIDETGVPPVGARIGRGRYPERAEVEQAFFQNSVRWVPARDMAKAIGPYRLTAAVMLGALSALAPTVDRDHLVMSLREALPSLADAEAEAFFAGYTFITGKDE
jgi:indolepyruvate ferredoxin oxidoreductase beta subunit